MISTQQLKRSPVTEEEARQTSEDIVVVVVACRTAFVEALLGGRKSPDGRATVLGDLTATRSNMNGTRIRHIAVISVVCIDGDATTPTRETMVIRLLVQVWISKVLGMLTERRRAKKRYELYSDTMKPTRHSSSM